MLAIDDKNDYFGFEPNAGGLFNFNGVMSNGKAIDNISINKNNNTVTVAYKDENQYLVSAQINELNNVVTINNISEKWNSQDTKNDIAMESLIAMLLGGASVKNIHPDVLEYKDDEYEIPEEITPIDNETFDSIIEKYKLNKNNYEEFDSTKQYQIGDILIHNNKIYKCISEHLGTWSDSDFKEIEYSEIIWGVGVINKGQSTEIINRLIYPDNSQISLINFNGDGGIS